MSDLWGWSTEYPSGVPLLSSISWTGTTLDDTSSDGEIAEVWIFRKDSVPYSKIEKRASKLFNTLHPRQKIGLEKPVIVAEDSKTLNFCYEFFAEESVYSGLEKLTILESALEDICNGK